MTPQDVIFGTINVPPALIAPFGVLLAAIAVVPLIWAAWWSRHYPKVIVALATLVIGYYFIELHAGARVGHAAHDYLCFITLIGSLYVVAGGIHITVAGEGTPRVNVLFLLIGALISNVLGTTGASVLLIHPWLRLNKHRIAGYHIVFFIFIVSNVGGCLTPVSDPPLFLGYLLGVPFWWVAAHGWLIWATGLGILLLMFYAVDRHHSGKETRTGSEPQKWRFDGLSNLFFLALIFGAVFIDNPAFVREAIMAAAATASYFTTPKAVHESNQFTFHPLKEVAILFFGIFATMMPALDWLETNAGALQSPSLGFFYAGAGGLSSILDSAPTYLCFVEALYGKFVHSEAIAQVVHLVQTHGAALAAVTGPDAPEIRGAFAALQQLHPSAIAEGYAGTDQIQMAFLLGNPKLSAYLLAVSIGAVFFGANTYLGNGPNLMVKAIAEHQKVPTPGFLAYLLKYALPIMGPLLLLIWLLFFHPSN